MATSKTLTRSVPAQASRGQHPGISLAVIATTQLMVVLDITIVNIALPHISTALHFTPTSLSWVLNAYTLTFGGLLLLGGRIGDILGRRPTLITGVLIFSCASLLGGLATASWMLLAARALQGIGGAIASPTAFALIATNFKEGPERNRAFGVYSAVAGAGGAIGLLLGGMLTSWLSWRWVLFVNVPIGLALAALAPLYINDSERHPGRFDLPGALTSTLGMVSLVYGFIRAADKGWTDTWTLASFAAAVVLLAAFLLIESRTEQPITPLHMFRNRNRSGAYVLMLCLAAAMFGIFFFMTQFIQDVLGFSPIRAGLGFLPMSLSIILAAQISARLQTRFGAKPFMILGTVLVNAGAYWITQLDVHSSYIGGVLGPTMIFGLGMGFIFVPVMLTAVSGVAPHETGSATGLLNTTQQVGGSLGLAILVTVFATAQRNEAKAIYPRHDPNQIFVHGMTTAFQMALVFTGIALLMALFVMKPPQNLGASAPPAPSADPSASSDPPHATSA
ncbi:MFS transporter [Streptacidiphilus melanogenes]|uniref:MFS transporter n=1 Tax=Streptacidiphilus melanogenes TaxID=411235 RepID=UPI0005AAE98E|nr:MFS transporter [Streptacidiphilus melanogenes]